MTEAKIIVYKLSKSLPFGGFTDSGRGLAREVATYSTRRSPNAAERVTVLKDITLRVYSGEVVSVLGPSGCGKSTLLRIVAGVWQPDVIEIDSKRTCEVLPALPTSIAWMPQRSPLVQAKTVQANVAIGAIVRNCDAKELSGRVTHSLAVVGLSEWGRAYPHELSGGMQQRVALARTLASQARVLLLDEPLSSLDVNLRQTIAERLRDYARTFAAAVMITTHTIEESIDFSDRVYILAGRPARITAQVALRGSDFGIRAAADADAQTEVSCRSRVEMLAAVYDALGAARVATSEEQE